VETHPQSGRYIVAIHHTPGGCYARVVNLPGCFARGASEVEALENLRASIRAYLAVAQLLAEEQPRVRLEISA
jgi:predicted RNase H-like HicB family nuclease